MNKNNKLIPDFKELLNQTVQFMRDNKLKDLDRKVSTGHSQSCWAIITEKICKKYDRYVALHIRDMWRRNTKKYREDVIKLLNVVNSNITNNDRSITTKNRSFVTAETDVNHNINLNEISIKISWKEWTELQQYVSNNKKTFLVGFTILLSQRVQRENINCFLKCSYNVFSTASKIKTEKCFWKGVYSCTNIECDITFNAFIKSIKTNEDVILNVTWYGNSKHQRETKEPRISARERKELGKKLLSRGTINVKAENILKNRVSDENFEGEL